MFPLGIHSDTIANSVSVMITPMSGNKFGCRRAFHDTNSLQNRCIFNGEYTGRGVPFTTHAADRLHVTGSASPQSLDGDLLPLVVSP